MQLLGLLFSQTVLLASHKQEMIWVKCKVKKNNREIIIRYFYV